MAIFIRWVSTVTIFLICVPDVVQLCSEPVGWKAKTMEERLGESKLVIHGTFILKEEVRPNLEYDYTVAVKCVLKNDLTTSTLPAEIKMRAYDDGGLCIVPRPVLNEESGSIIQIAYNDEERIYEFDHRNIQSSYYKATQDTLEVAMSVCGFQNPSPPQIAGASCSYLPRPDPKDDACKKSRAEPVTYSLLSLLFLLFVHFY